MVNVLWVNEEYGILNVEKYDQDKYKWCKITEDLEAPVFGMNQYGSIKQKGEKS